MRPAMELIAQVPPIEIEGRIAACDGGTLLRMVL
jgi:hypothetical protein